MRTNRSGYYIVPAHLKVSQFEDFMLRLDHRAPVQGGLGSWNCFHTDLILFLDPEGLPMGSPGEYGWSNEQRQSSRQHQKSHT